MKKSNTYDKKYGDQNYYWGKKPSAMCDTIIQIMRPNEKFHPRLLDLGCGEGRNAVYFAKHGSKWLVWTSLQLVWRKLKNMLKRKGFM